MTTIKQINSVMAIVGTAVTTFELMMKTFKWYEKLHGKKDKNKKDEIITRPIIKGL